MRLSRCHNYRSEEVTKKKNLRSMHRLRLGLTAVFTASVRRHCFSNQHVNRHITTRCTDKDTKECRGTRPKQTLAGPTLSGPLHPAHLNTRFAVVHNDPVRQVGSHDEVMLHHKRSLLGVKDEPLDQLGAGNALQAGARRWAGRDNNNDDNNEGKRKKTGVIRAFIPGPEKCR